MENPQGEELSQQISHQYIPLTELKNYMGRELISSPYRAKFGFSKFIADLKAQGQAYANHSLVDTITRLEAVEATLQATTPQRVLEPDHPDFQFMTKQVFPSFFF